MKRYTLPKEFGEKWIAALRSGEYKQGRGMYFNQSDDCYCSIGVGLIANSFELDDRGSNVIGDFDPMMECMPLNKGDGTLWYTIYTLNDEQNKSFTEIADWIEANVELN